MGYQVDNTTSPLCFFARLAHLKAYLDRAVIQYSQAREFLDAPQAREFLDALQALPKTLAVESHLSCPLGINLLLSRRDSESLDGPA